MRAGSQAGVGLDGGRVWFLHNCWLLLTWSLEPQCPPC